MPTLSSLFATPTPTPAAVPISDGSSLLDAWVTSGSGGTGDIQAMLDTISSVHGAILFRGASQWEALLPGPDGKALLTHGSGADPTWGSPSTLLVDLIEYWELGEASGNRVGSDNGYVMAPINSPGSSAGVGGVGLAAQFVSSSSQSLEMTNISAIEIGDFDFSFAGWINLTSTANYASIFNKWQTPDFEFIVYFDKVGNVFRFLMNGADGIKSVAATTFGAPSAGTWYFLYAQHDAAANNIKISVNAGAMDSTAYTGGGIGTAAPLCIGKVDATNFSDSLAAKVGYWKRKLTTLEIATLAVNPPPSYPF